MITSWMTRNVNATSPPGSRRHARTARHVGFGLAGVAVIAIIAVIGGGSAQAGRHAVTANELRHNGRIVFQAVVGHSTQLFTINPDGTGRRQITHVAESDPTQDQYPENPAWGANGTIAFDAQAGHGVNIYTVSPGHRPHALPLSVGAFNGDPAYSPDGRQISFDQDIGDSNPKVHGIFIANADGSDAHRVTTGIRSTDSYDTESQWSPDGRRLAFTRVESSTLAAVFIVNIDGSGLRRLTPWALDAASPDWSPDGSKIIFSSYFDPHPGESANIYSIRPDGSEQTQLTHASGPEQLFRPSWSPDGTKILFSRVLTAQQHATADLYTMDPNGTDFQRVTDMPNAFPNQGDWGSAS